MQSVDTGILRLTYNYKHQFQTEFVHNLSNSPNLELYALR